MGRVVAAKFEVAWDGTNFIDESAYLIQAEATLQLAPAASALFAGRGTADSMTVRLWDSGGRFNPFKSSGALYSYLQNGGAYHRPARMSIQVDGGSWVRVFTGVLKLPKELSPKKNDVGQVTFTVRSNDELLMNDRQSTEIVDMALLMDRDEATIIEAWLDQAGISVLDMTIDPGLFQIPAAWLDDEPVVPDCWELAAACGGRFYCNVDGEYCYENAFHWLTSPHTTSQQTYEYDVNYQRLNLVLDDSDLFSDITVVAAARVTGPVGVLWQPDAPIVIPANTSKTVMATFRQPLAGVEGTLTYTAVTSGGVRVTSGLSVGVPTWYAQRAEIAIVNSNAFQVVLQQAQITGKQLVGGNQHEETAASTNGFWTSRSRRVRRFGNNAYVQTPAQASALVEIMRDWSQVMRVRYELEQCVGVPERRVGDLVTISHPIMLPDGNKTGYITKLGWKWDHTGFMQSVEAIDAATLYPYASSPGYFIIGVSPLGASSKRIFY